MNRFPTRRRVSRLGALVYAAIVSTLALAACSTPDPTVVAALPIAPQIAAECITPDPAWTDVPDRDVRRAELARLWRTNKERFGDMRAARRVCRASVVALQKGG